MTGNRSSGYTMVAIAIFLLLLSISLMEVAPLVTKVMQRDREEELLFRGKQYALAFLNFQKRQGRFPLNLKELMQTQPRSARKLFKDPMCDCDDWGLIHVGQPWPPPAVNPADSATGLAGLPAGAGTDDRQRPGQPSSPLPSSYTQPPPSGNQGQDQRNRGNGAGSSNDSVFQDSGQEVNLTPIIGVYSKVHKKGLRTFQGQEYYDLWGFIAGQNNDDLPNVSPLSFKYPITKPDSGSLGGTTSGTPPPPPN